MLHIKNQDYLVLRKYFLKNEEYLFNLQEYDNCNVELNNLVRNNLLEIVFKNKKHFIFRLTTNGGVFLNLLNNH